MMFDAALLSQAAKLMTLCRERQWQLATAESCTGGLLAGLLTSIAGASQSFGYGFVTYSNAAKTDLLGVDAALIAAHGAVSEEVARAMALGAKAKSGAQLALAITGIAGPGGGSTEKPVGLVFIAIASDTGVVCERCLFADAHATRDSIRSRAIAKAISMGIEILA